MNSRFRKLSMESLEERSLMATTAYADFNSDGLMDVAAITAPNTITVSLFNPADGSYTVSAILTAPKNQPISGVAVADLDRDGNLDVSFNSPSNGGGMVSTHQWLGNGDGTFDSMKTDKWSWPPKGNHGDGW